MMKVPSSLLKAIVFLFMGVVAVWTALVSTAWAEGLEVPVDIRRSIEVVDEVVRLEDVFTGIEKSRYKERVIIESPAPGEHFVLPAKWLERLARSYRVKWKPLTRFDEVEVFRKSRRVGEEELKAAITEGIRRRFPNDKGDYMVELDNGSREWHLPANMEGELDFRRVEYNASTGRFRAVVEVSDSSRAGHRKNFPIKGVAHKLVRVPVLTRHYAKGEVIEDRDVALKSFRHNRLPSYHVMAMSEIRNMAARTRIEEGKAIKLNQVEKPLWVRSKNLVMVELITPRLTMRLRAQALEDGHEGEVIRVKNLKSKKVFEVEVIGMKSTRLIVSNDANVAFAP
jgi:flagella basal body P-ring formation protein FlgA